MPLKICLLTDQDLDADPFPSDDWPCDPRPFLPEAEWTLLTLQKDAAVGQVVEAVSEGFDLFFNLCDGAWDEGRVGVEVIQTLEQLDVPFTGADSVFFEPTRDMMKRVCVAWGVDTPGYLIAREPDDVERALDLLRFPLIVKHPQSYASVGLTRDSRVTDAASLRSLWGEKVREWGSVLIEEFIDGLEATVLVAEDPADPSSAHAYRPILYRFPEGETFKHYDLKWTDFHGLSTAPVEDPALDELLRRASVDFFLGMRGAGYGRCDIRVGADGRAYMLEINPNCGLYYPQKDPGSADLILAADPGGHEGFTRRVVDAALARHQRRKTSWRVLPRASRDHGVFAARDVAEGETIVEWDGRAHRVVTRSQMERRLAMPDRDWFARYTWPLSDGVFVTMSDDPREWRPVNHGCDPNVWLEGLDLVARRPIRRGEEILVDYATFHDETMPPFTCTCGSDECRQTVRGDDYLLERVGRYRDHLSDHVARRRARDGR
jgi:D-alanine-D-alanine ligase-like ATP-grasp enzyme